MRRIRRIAVHELVTDTGERFPMVVVELLGDRIVDWYPLKGEPPFTEWYGGTLQASHDALGRLIVCPESYLTFT